MAYTRVIGLMDSLRAQLSKEDPTGERLDVSTRILVHTPTSGRLGSALVDLGRACRIPSILDVHRDPKTDSRIRTLEELTSGADWQKSYFEQAPTVAAITMLNKFKLDCTKAAIASMQEIVDFLID